MQTPILASHSWTLGVHVRDRPMAKSEHRSLRVKRLASVFLKLLFPAWKIGTIIKNRLENDFKKII